MMIGNREIDVTVSRIRQETSQIRSFVLEPSAGQTLPPFEAGAHIDVAPAPNVIRQYSLVNDPSDRGPYLLGVKREVNGRGGSLAMHQLREGSCLKISPPRNKFALRQDGARSILIAGGIGVTPLLSMAQSLAYRGANFELNYFVQSNSDLAFCDLINDSPWARNVAYHFGVVPPALFDVLEEMLAE